VELLYSNLEVVALEQLGIAERVTVLTPVPTRTSFAAQAVCAVPPTVTPTVPVEIFVPLSPVKLPPAPEKLVAATVPPNVALPEVLIVKPLFAPVVSCTDELASAVIVPVDPV
jgi:hypothetical protein